MSQKMNSEWWVPKNNKYSYFLMNRMNYGTVLMKNPKCLMRWIDLIQGRRRLLESGTGIEHRCFHRVPTIRGGGEKTRGGVDPPLVRGVRGTSPKKTLKFKMTKEAILLHFETIFACEPQLILQAL